MGKKKQKGGSHQPIKGFRPGKEPAHLRKRQAKKDLGKDAPASQKKIIDLVAHKTPGQVHAMVTRWMRGAILLGALLVVAGYFLFGWHWLAGGGALLLAVVLFVLAWRMRGQRSNFVQIAEMVGKGSRG